MLESLQIEKLFPSTFG